jgi:uncharacterized protein YprB with RNaseH-like and TPR domain
MPSLSDKLKSLGVSLGAEELSSEKRRQKYPIEEVLEGRVQQTPYGEAFIVQADYPEGYLQGRSPLSPTQKLNTISSWANDPRLSELPPNNFVFLDTETSGLAGGTGTYAFLIGVGRFNSTGFELIQYFMRDPLEESAQLAALMGYLGERDGLVTFNGKSFDVPLLNSRFTFNGEPTPLKSSAHLDLLPLARRLWRDRLPSRTLGYLEEHILEVKRTGEDVPGWLVPQLYFDYLRSGDARPLKSVFYHNAMDILSLAALLNHMAAILEEPVVREELHGIDLIATGKLYEDLGELDQAERSYAAGLAHDLPDDIRSQGMYRWSIMEKRRENYTRACELWIMAAEEEYIFAFEELAKYYEHREKDYTEAINWTEKAILLIRAEGFSRIERYQWLPAFEHRLIRLQRKLDSSNTGNG